MKITIDTENITSKDIDKLIFIPVACLLIAAATNKLWLMLLGLYINIILAIIQRKMIAKEQIKQF